MRVAVVGAGIVGLAHAWAAARRGHQVTLYERSPAAQGASVRNFGMVWPIGQPAGAGHATALRSREAWLELGREAGVWVAACGSLHLAHRADEWAVLEEFYERAADLGYHCELLDPAAVRQRTPAANPENLQGALASSEELAVDPRQAIRTIPGWLATRHGVDCRFGAAVVQAGEGQVRTAAGMAAAYAMILVCPGADFESLHPRLLAASGLVRCKLQMLKTAVQPAAWRQGPHLASGLTLRHYKNFALCPSLAALQERIARETPELDRMGIHVMAAQNAAGEVILGDSHEYEDQIQPFDKPLIDMLILRELAHVIRLPDWTITERWHGVYAKHPTAPVMHLQPDPSTWLITGTGGAGMTMSFGLAEEFWTDRE